MTTPAATTPSARDPFIDLAVRLEAVHATALVDEAAQHLRSAQKAARDEAVRIRLREAVEELDSAASVLRFVITQAHERS